MTVTSWMLAEGYLSVTLQAAVLLTAVFRCCRVSGAHNTGILTGVKHFVSIKTYALLRLRLRPEIDRAGVPITVYRLASSANLN